MENIIRVEELTKKYGDKVALNKISFTVRKGEIFGFLGPSGAGKTTAIKVLTSQLGDIKGKVSVLNNDVLNPNKDFLRSIGVLSDNSGFYERLTVSKNLEIFAGLYDIDKSKVKEILKEVGLYEDRKKVAKDLSKGMKQRMVLSRALIHNPKVLFLDEPTSALDPGTSLAIHKLLLKMKNNGTTIFLTTHNMEEADKLCDRVAFLNEGQIVELNTPDNLKLKYAENKIEVKIHPDSEIVLVNNDIEGFRKINEWVKSDKLLSIHSKEPNLEEVFLKVTGRDL